MPIAFEQISRVRGYTPGAPGAASAPQVGLAAPSPAQGEEPAYIVELSGEAPELGIPRTAEQAKDEFKPALIGEKECETCANRTYMDGSDDSTVSFQAPGKIDSANAAGVVAAHERQHVFHESADAQLSGRKILRQSVSIHYDTCPDCGRPYVSGGTTRTVSQEQAERDYTRVMSGNDGTSAVSVAV